MSQILRKLAVFSIPFLLWGAFIAVVDPFGYFTWSHFIDPSVKAANIRDLNSLLFNSLSFRANPSPYVLIGDSRTARFPLDYLEEVSGQRYSRLTSNAAKLNEIVDLYWLANSVTTLKSVYIGLNFNMYNEFAYADRVRGLQQLLDNPLLYVYNKDVGEAAIVVVRAVLQDEIVVKHSLPMSEDDFWDWNIRVKATHHFARYRHPDVVYERIRAMCAHAAAHDIDLAFIIVPHHADFRQRVSDFDLDAESLRFEAELAALAPVFNFDRDSEMTLRRSNFGDPIHMAKHTAERVIDEVWGGQLENGVRLFGGGSESLVPTSQR